MAKKTTKTVTKTSKKGLIIGIVVGALVLAGAGVGGYFIWKSFQKDEPTPTTKKATFELAKDTPKLYGHLIDEKGYEIKTVDLTSKIGKELKDETFYFMPNEGIETGLEVTITGGKFKAEYSEPKIEGKPGIITVNSDGGYKLRDKDKLVAEFRKPVPPVVDTWTLSLDGDSVNYGSFDKNPGVTSIDCPANEKEVTVNFWPVEEYKETKFNVTDTKSIVKAVYTPQAKEGIASITISKQSGGAFEKDETVELHFEEPESTFTVTLKSGKGYFKEQGVTEQTITGVEPNTSFADAIKDVVNPICDEKIDPDDGGPDLDLSFIYYVDNDGNRINDDYEITSNITATAEYSIECLGLENVSSVTQHISLTKAQSTSTYGNPAPNVSYALSTDLADWEVWSDYSTDTPTTIDIEPGETVYFKGNNTSGFIYGNDLSYEYGWEFGDGSTYEAQEVKIVAHGNPMGLIDNGACDIVDFPVNSGLCYLFADFYDLDIADDFVLPSTKLYNTSYKNLFFNCYNLTKAPDLPVDSLPEYCCNSMFLDCYKLLKPAKFTVEGDISVSGMYSCASMYSGCRSMDEMPDLSHLKFENTAFRSMETMFILTGIEKIEKDKMPTISELDFIPVGIFMDAFKGCTQLTEADISNITRTGQWCFYRMFAGCTNLSSLTVGFGTPDSNVWPKDPGGVDPATLNWFDEYTPTGEAEALPGPQSGTFYWKGTDSGSIDIGRSVSTIPENGWTIESTSPVTTYAVTPLGRTDVTRSTINFDESSYAPGSLVTGTIVPETDCSLPEYARAIFFYADNEYNVPIDISVTYNKEDGGVFSFTMPEQDVYVGAICHLTTTCNLSIKSEHENCPSSAVGTYGQMVIITYNNPEGGYHIAKDLDEFLSTHYVIGDYENSSDVLSYSYVEDEEGKGTGTLKIDPLHSGYIIRGSAPADPI